MSSEMACAHENENDDDDDDDDAVKGFSAAHEALCRQLIYFDKATLREIYAKKNPPRQDPPLASSSFFSSAMPACHPITMEFIGEEFQALEKAYCVTLATR
jgi:hypothetical protein